jgi:hypothetical protein
MQPHVEEYFFQQVTKLYILAITYLSCITDCNEVTIKIFKYSLAHRNIGILVKYYA